MLFLIGLLLLAVSSIAKPGHHEHSAHGHGHHGPGGHEHPGPGHGHGPDFQRVHREHSQHGQMGPQMQQPVPPCGCGAPHSRPMVAPPQSGIPIFLFPDHAQKAVDVVLGAEGAFFWDNDELAHRLFDLLAHKFPQKWFIVGVGNSPGDGLGLRVQKASVEEFLHGSVKVSPVPAPFAYIDRRHMPRENETQLWYFVKAVEPEEAEGNSAEGGRKLAECVRKETKSCIPASLASACHLDFLVLIDQDTKPGLYASEPVSTNPALMKVLNSIGQCSAENEGIRFYALMAGGASEESGED